MTAGLLASLGAHIERADGRRPLRRWLERGGQSIDGPTNNRLTSDMFIYIDECLEHLFVAGAIRHQRFYLFEFGNTAGSSGLTSGFVARANHH